jgi:hypothetical protein
VPKSPGHLVVQGTRLHAAAELAPALGEAVDGGEDMPVLLDVKVATDPAKMLRRLVARTRTPQPRRQSSSDCLNQ